MFNVKKKKDLRTSLIVSIFGIHLHTSWFTGSLSSTIQLTDNQENAKLLEMNFN